MNETDIHSFSLSSKCQRNKNEICEKKRNKYTHTQTHNQREEAIQKTRTLNQ